MSFHQDLPKDTGDVLWVVGLFEAVYSRCCCVWLWVVVHGKPTFAVPLSVVVYFSYPPLVFEFLGEVGLGDTTEIRVPPSCGLFTVVVGSVGIGGGVGVVEYAVEEDEDLGT